MSDELELEPELGATDAAVAPHERPMTPKAATAFEVYAAMGPTRSLRKAAERFSRSVSQFEQWSSRYGWVERLAAQQREELEAARAAARKEAATLAKRRLRNAQLLQEVGVTILSKADIANLGKEEARKMAGIAMGLIQQGMQAERRELDLSTENLNLAPKKPLQEMDQAELDAYIAMLEGKQGA